MASEMKREESAFELIQNNPHANIQAINALISRTGYPLSQENGQRRYGPPADWAKRPVPDRGCEAFIGKIPRDCFEDELVPVLERIGPLYEFRLMMEYSGFNRGYGFVMYTCREHARKCVDQLNNFEIRKGKMIGVCRSVDNCRLFVGGIPKNKKREEILDEMRKVTDDVLNVIVYPSAHDKTKNRGFAFVQYSSHRAAAIARRKLIPNRVQIFGQPIAVDWAEPEPEVDEDVMATVKVVYVRNLMLTTSEHTIKSEFEKATTEGAIDRVKKVKDFAFVHFKEREKAIDCINKLNGTSIDGSTIELSLSKPADKVNLQKLLRANPNQLLDYGFLLAQNVLQPAISAYAIVAEPSAQLAPCDLLASDAQSVAIASHSMDLNQKILNVPNRPYSAPTTKSFAKNKQLSRFFNLNKVSQNGLVIGNVKKQPSNQDVPYEFIQNYNQLPVLAYPGQVFPYIPRSYVNVLEDICNKEGLNQPVYTLHTTSGTDQDGKEIGLYMYKITLSNSTNPGPICSNRLMRTIEEAKNDAAEFVISQYFPQYIQSMADMNDQYIHCQTTSVMPNAMIPTVPYVAAGEAQVSPADSNSQDVAQDQNSNISLASNESNNAIAQSQYFLSQPSHIPSLTTPQYVFDSNGQCILYPTQTFY